MNSHTYGLDASAAAVEKPTGVGLYIRSLLRALSAVDAENGYVVCYRLSRLSRRQHFVTGLGPNFRRKIIQEPFNPFFWRGLDLFHGLDLKLPRYRIPRVATVHDLGAIDDPGVGPEGFSRTRSRHLESALAADHIITHSETVRRSLIERYAVPPERVTAVHLAPVHAREQPPSEVTGATLARLGLARPYVLHVGEISRRKDVAGLIRWFLALERPDLDLVLCGPKGHAAGEELAGASSLGDRLHLPGYLDAALLPALYAGARLFAIWSRFEGFGIPPLEAMACGTPVLAARRGALPEILGDAALLVEPSDLLAAVAMAREVLDDGPLREETLVRGRGRALQFTWERTARQTLEVYRRVAGPGSRYGPVRR